MINCYNVRRKNAITHSLERPYILQHPYRILIIGGSGSGIYYSI